MNSEARLRFASSPARFGLCSFAVLERVPKPSEDPQATPEARCTAVSRVGGGARSRASLRPPQCQISGLLPAGDVVAHRFPRPSERIAMVNPTSQTRRARACDRPLLRTQGLALAETAGSLHEWTRRDERANPVRGRYWPESGSNRRAHTTRLLASGERIPARSTRSLGGCH